MTRRTSATTVLVLVFSISFGTSQSPAAVLRNSAFSGATVNVAGSGYRLRGTVGEVGVVGRSTGPGYVLTAGIWGPTADGGTVTPVDPEVPPNLGLNLRVAPNPFNPATSFLFNQPSSGRVRVRIYDISGRLVRVIDAGNLQAGAQAIQWNARDMAGAIVSSGSYFARVCLDGAGLDDVVKLTLLK